MLKPGHQIYVYTDENDVLRLAQIPAAQAALISLDSHNGAIKAVVGGFSFKQSKFNRAEQAKRQAGSNIKPFVYSAALNNGYQHWFSMHRYHPGKPVKSLVGVLKTLQMFMTGLSLSVKHWLNQRTLLLSGC